MKLSIFRFSEKVIFSIFYISKVTFIQLFKLGPEGIIHLLVKAFFPAASNIPIRYVSIPLISGGRRPKYMGFKIKWYLCIKDGLHCFMYVCPVIQYVLTSPENVVVICSLTATISPALRITFVIVCLHILPAGFFPCMRFCASPLKCADILPFFLCYL